MGKRKQEKPTRKFQNVEFDDDEEEDYDPYYKTRTSPQQVKKPKISSPKQATPSPKTSPTRKPYPPTIGTAETSANAQQAAENLNALHQLATQFGAQNAPRQDDSRDIDVSQHIGDKPFTCIFCGIDFTEKSMLTKHIQQVHTEQQPVDVPTDRQDQQPDAGLIPTGAQDATPFICHVCGAGFTRMTNLNKHIQTNHTVTKPLQCHVCGNGFTTPSNLKRHIRTLHADHQPVLKPTGGQADEPFKCHYCDQSYSTKKYLIFHISNIHSEQQPVLDTLPIDNQDEKPFKCRICDKCYTRKYNLNVHIKNIHKGTRSNAPAQPPIMQPAEETETQPTLQPTIPQDTPKIQKQPCYLARGTDEKLWCLRCQLKMAPCSRMG